MKLKGESRLEELLERHEESRLQKRRAEKKAAVQLQKEEEGRTGVNAQPDFSVFGNRKATKNASANEDVPIKIAMSMSLK